MLSPEPSDRPVGRSRRACGRVGERDSSNTVGSVPAASFAANVGPVHWYSTGLTLIDGFAFSNSVTCALNCAIAALVLPGISEATLMVVCDELLDVFFAAALEIAETASTAAPATITAVRMDFIVLPLDFIVLSFL